MTDIPSIGTEKMKVRTDGDLVIFVTDTFQIGDTVHSAINLISQNTGRTVLFRYDRPVFFSQIDSMDPGVYYRYIAAENSKWQLRVYGDEK